MKLPPRRVAGAGEAPGPAAGSVDALPAVPRWELGPAAGRGPAWHQLQFTAVLHRKDASMKETQAPSSHPPPKPGLEEDI